MYAEAMSYTHPSLTRGFRPALLAPMETKACIKLYRAMGPGQLLCIQKSNWRAFPARLPDQAFFYPLSNLALAQNIARQWNQQRSGAGFVVEFSVNARFLQAYQKDELAGGEGYEYRIPAQDMDALNAQLVGPIKVVDACFSPQADRTLVLSPTATHVSTRKVALI